MVAVSACHQMDGAPLTVDRRSSVESKIRLFRSLFRGREDVYPRRFESRKTGRSGYGAGMLERMGARHLRKAAGQVR